jgi:hypothetical protein
MVEPPPSADEEHDFEWVNAWAAAAGRQTGGAPPRTQAPTPMVTPGRPTKPAAAENDSAASLPPLAGAPAGTPLLEGRPAQRWTNLFRIVGREGEAEADPVRRRPPDDALPLRSNAAVSRHDGEVSPHGTAQRSPEATMHGQLARDISEIQIVRDQLLHEETPSEPPNMPTRRFAAVRTSDYIPLLVGGVLAFTSLVMFGAAMSLISLR